MQSKAPSTTKQSTQVNQLAQQSAETKAVFEDSRDEMSHLRAQQIMFEDSHKSKNLLTLQAKIESKNLYRQKLLQKKQLSMDKESVIQRAPIGAFTAAVPAVNGMFMDTASTVTHNSNVNGNANVAGRRIAIMRGPANGGVPSVDPHGWNWLRAKFLRLKGQWVRFHLINAKLGGSGADTLNLVPTAHTLNHDANWRKIEEDAKKSANSTWTYFEVTPVYDPAYPAGIPRTIQGEWGKWDALNSTWITQGIMPATAQDNPVNSVQPYSDASTLNLQTLKNIIRANMPKTNKKGTNKFKNKSVPSSYKVATGLSLLTKSYQSQYLLDAEWEIFLDKIDSDIAKKVWQKIMNRVYLTEEGPAPWPLVYRK